MTTLVGSARSALTKDVKARIEPNSALVFDVDLVSVTPGPESPKVAANLTAKNR